MSIVEWRTRRGAGHLVRVIGDVAESGFADDRLSAPAMWMIWSRCLARVNATYGEAPLVFHASGGYHGRNRARMGQLSLVGVVKNHGPIRVL